MKSFLLSSLAAVVLAAISPAWSLAADPPTVKLPADQKAEPGQLIRLTAETDGKTVRWIVCPDGADLIPFPDGKIAIFSARKPGRYAVHAYTAAGDLPSEPARCTITVEPLAPPVPPTPPAPSDPLAIELKALYAADTSGNKANDVKTLAALYRLMALECAKSEYTTAGQINARYRAAVAAVVPPLGIVDLRKRAAVEVIAAAGTDPDAAVTDAIRGKLAQTFTRLAACCDEVLR